MKVIPVIMAGGAGTRLWPLSREDKPKQFHNLSGDGTLLECTIKRLFPLNPEQVVIVTADKYKNLSKEELKKFKIEGSVLLEPRPRNTAAAVLYAAIYLHKLYTESIMIVLPADHFIKNNEEFIKVLHKAVGQADMGKLVTIGIKPLYPETGYGYIKAIESKGEILDVDKFVEKPNLERAGLYFKSGNYFWNSGIFIWKTSAILEAFKVWMPDHINAFESLASLSAQKIASDEKDVWEIKKKIFDSIKSVSIDIGILESAENKVVIPGDFGWADLGSWKAIDDILQPDENQNRTPDPTKTIFVNSNNCSVFSEEKRISVVGLSNVVVIQAGNEVLVIDKNSCQDVRSVVDIVKGSGK